MSEEQNYESVLISKGNVLTLPKESGEDSTPYLKAFAAASGKLIDGMVSADLIKTLNNASLVEMRMSVELLTGDNHE